MLSYGSRWKLNTMLSYGSRCGVVMMGSDALSLGKSSAEASIAFTLDYTENALTDT
ncbi:hypothetical protein ACLK29_13645 [Leptospira kirschneri]|uniref:hypothetical protein n=1 Tax=Leptospira kirschneri TaxID=29507 RepID=UPI00398AE151